MAQSEPVGVIDIGTLKVKLLIAKPQTKTTYTILHESNQLTGLGVRMHENNNRPFPEKLDATIAELARCKSLLKTEGVKRVRVVSTHALREMGVIGKEIAETIHKKVGFKVEIISQNEEADLFFKAVIGDFASNRDYTVIDVGGGSVQVLIGNREELKHTFLLKTGSQRLHDVFSPRHTGSDFPKRSEIRKMKQYILTELLPVPERIGTPLIVGSSCIIDIYKAMKINLAEFSDSPSHPYKTELSELEGFLESVIPMPYDTREQTYKNNYRYYMWGIDKALLNVTGIARRVGAPYVIPSNANINKGLVLSLL